MVAAVHLPTRTCVVCRTRSDKKNLFRLALDRVTAQIVLDERQRLPGRGAYVCAQCVQRLSFSNRVQRAFRNKACGFSEGLIARHREREL